MLKSVTTLLYSLSRCPVCKTRPSSAKGCCAVCAAALFSPRITDFELTLGHYEGRLERAVRAFKFHGVTRLGVLFGEAMADAVRESAWQVDFICPMPLHTRRRLERGYNQSALITQTVARRLGVSHRHAVKRVRATQQQARLSRRERQQNVSGAFRAAPLKGERVLLVDDVMTSGATLTECSLELLEAGASQVYIAAVATPLRTR